MRQEQLYLLDDLGTRILWMNEAARGVAPGKGHLSDLFVPPVGSTLDPQAWLDSNVTAARQSPQTFVAQRRAGAGSDPVEITLVALDAVAGRGLSVLLARVSPRTVDSVDDQHLQRVQRMEAVGQLAGGLAHDFNNLLTVVSGNLELLLLELEDAGVSDSAELVDEALSAVRRGADLTQRLLAFARQRPLAPERLDIGKVIAELGPLFARTLGPQVRTKICSQNLDPVDRFVVVDKSQLESSLLNLSINAQDAMPEGGELHIELLTRECSQPEMANGLCIPAGKHVHVRVSDSGIGIAPDVLTKVLDPFFTTKRSGRGSGLGLSTVYGFAKQSGGLIRVESPPDSGAVITLALPLASNSVTVEGVTASGPNRLVAGEGTVLIVEDESAVRRLASEVLTTAGYRVVEAESADAAMALLKSGQSFDVLFTDLYFPGSLSSEAFVRYVAENYPDCPIVATSGYVDRHDRSELRIASFLSKPYSPGDLVDTLARAFERRSGAQAAG